MEGIELVGQERYHSVWAHTNIYGDHAEIVQRKTVRELRVNRVWQGAFDVQRPERLLTPYMQQMMLALLYPWALRRFLVIGHGAGCLPRALWAVAPWARIDSIEIDPEILAATHLYMHVPPAPPGGAMRHTPGVRLHLADGCDFLAAPPTTYDAIFVDAFVGDELPGGLFSPQVLLHLRQALRPGGVAAINVPQFDVGIGRRAMQSLVRYLGSPRVYDPRTPERHDFLNLIAVTPVPAASNAYLHRRRAWLRSQSETLGVDVDILVANRVY